MALAQRLELLTTVSKTSGGNSPAGKGTGREASGGISKVLLDILTLGLVFVCPVSFKALDKEFRLFLDQTSVRRG